MIAFVLGIITGLLLAIAITEITDRLMDDDQ